MFALLQRGFLRRVLSKNFELASHLKCPGDDRGDWKNADGFIKMTVGRETGRKREMHSDSFRLRAYWYRSVRCQGDCSSEGNHQKQ